MAANYFDLLLFCVLSVGSGVWSAGGLEPTTSWLLGSVLYRYTPMETTKNTQIRILALATKAIRNKATPTKCALPKMLDFV